MTTIAAPRINFPTFTTPLIGRDADVATITTRLRRSPHRFATLVGTSGTGKTRLSMQIAAAMEAVDPATLQRVLDLPFGKFLAARFVLFPLVDLIHRIASDPNHSRHGIVSASDTERCKYSRSEKSGRTANRSPNTSNLRIRSSLKFR